MKILILCFALTMGGCKTCEQHPVWCAVGAAVIVGSAVAIAEAHHDHNARNIRQDLGFPCRESDGRATGVIGSYKYCMGR